MTEDDLLNLRNELLLKIEPMAASLLSAQSREEAFYDIVNNQKNGTSFSSLMAYCLGKGYEYEEVERVVDAVVDKYAQ